MLYEFLQTHRNTLLEKIEKTTLDLSEVKANSAQLKEGLTIFYDQLLEVLREQVGDPSTPSLKKNKSSKLSIVDESSDVVKSAGLRGKEFLRLGYSLSHVVHAYGNICQAITQLAVEQDVLIISSEFRKLNLCLDIAIASAVGEYQYLSEKKIKDQEIQSLGFLAHELRNALNSINISLHLIKSGKVGFSGSTGEILELNLKRMNDLIGRSLTQVRLRVEPQIFKEKVYLIEIVDQIMVTALIEARERNQKIDVGVDSHLLIEIDEHLFFSALSNLIQNALKYSRLDGLIQVRGFLLNGEVIVEVEDECGGLKDETVNLFKPYEQQNENKTGLGLGLTIAQKAIDLNQGKIEVQNLPGKGCIFRMKLPQTIEALG